METENWVNKVPYFIAKNSLIFYTDVSLKEGTAGTGTGLSPKVEISTSLWTYATLFQVKIRAIITTLIDIRNKIQIVKISTYVPIVKQPPQVVNSSIISSELVKECVDKLNHECRNNHFTIIRVSVPEEMKLLAFWPGRAHLNHSMDQNIL